MSVIAIIEAMQAADCDAETILRAVKAFELKRITGLRDRVSRNIHPNLRAFIISRDGEVCSYCGTEHGPFEIDHVMPFSRGGTDHPDNLTVACVPCNRSKGAKTPQEWLG